MCRPLASLICVLGLLGPTAVWAATPFSLLVVDDGHVCNDSQYGPNAVYNTPAIHIRNIDAPRRRVGFLKFDISSIRSTGGVVSNVSVSVYGYGAGDVDVYGVIESLDDTVADFQLLTWNTAPGVKNNPAPALSAPVELDMADLVGPLFSFRTPAADVRASSPTSQALADFINADTDGIIVLLLSAPVGQSAMLRELDWNTGQGGAKLEGEVGAAAVQARNPDPADKAVDVWRDAILSWSPGGSVTAHNVYVGTSLENVTAAEAGVSPNVLSSLSQDANSYDPPGHLELGRTYYWRVDEVNGAPDFTVHKGAVWTFTVEPFAREIGNIIATASSSDVGGGPESTVNGSGLDGNLLHSTGDKTMWLSGKNAPQPTWIRYEFDRVYKLHEMWVWNYNMSIESSFGLGFKAVAVEYSINGVDWTALGDSEFAQGSSADGYAHNTTVNFQDVAARYVRLTAKSNWGGFVNQYGLSEVKFFYIPVQASVPNPASGQTGVSPDALLSWRAGREAASHEVYFSVNKQAVVDGTALAGTVSQCSYDPASLNLEVGKTYYWKVVEVNQVGTPSAWESDVWSFSTREYIVIDDFESYTNDSPNRVFQAWIDGWGFSEDGFFPAGNPGNGTGSMVGYDPEAGNIMETTIIHGGKQAMPVEYNNVNQPYYSEVERTWQTPQNWTVNGADTLQVWFRGNPVGFVQTSPTSITMGAGGTDIYGTADQFTFAYKSFNGDGSIIVRVDGIENTDPWAKAGVMIRESLSPDSRFAGVYATPGQGVRFQARLLTAGDATSDTSVATPEQIALRAPVWVKLERAGTTVNGYYSTDGSKWTAMSWNPQTINMMGQIYIGLAVTSHNVNLATTGVFSNASTSGGASGSWQFAEIGIDHQLNDRDNLYVALKDSAGHTAVVTHSDADAVLRNTWQAWNIPLADLRSGGVNVAAIKAMYIGVGDRKKSSPTGTGVLFIDDIGFGRSAAVAP
jgi:hypothetical protein